MVLISRCCSIAAGVLGLVFLAIGLPMLIIPNDRVKALRRYNEAVTKWNSAPPSPFVLGSPVGTVTLGNETANLTTVLNPRWTDVKSGDELVPDERYLQGWLPYSVNVTVVDEANSVTVPTSGLTFTFAGRTFHRAYPFMTESLGQRIWCGPAECEGTPESCRNPSTRRCTAALLRRSCRTLYFYADNYTGASECFGEELCGRCVEYRYPISLCAVVNVEGDSIAPNVEFQSCHYPFTLADSEYGTSPSSGVRVEVRASSDPWMVKERLLGPSLPYTCLHCYQFDDIKLTRTWIGLAFVIAGAVILLAVGVSNLCWCCCRRRRSSAKADSAAVPAPPVVGVPVLTRDGRTPLSDAEAVWGAPSNAKEAPTAEEWKEPPASVGAPIV